MEADKVFVYLESLEQLMMGRKIPTDGNKMNGYWEAAPQLPCGSCVALVCVEFVPGIIAGQGLQIDEQYVEIMPHCVQ